MERRKKVLFGGAVVLMVLTVLSVAYVFTSKSTPESSEEELNMELESLGLSYRWSYPIAIVLSDERGAPIEDAEVYVRYHDTSNSWDVTSGFEVIGQVSEDSIFKGHVVYRTNWRFNHNDEVDIKVVYEGRTYLVTANIGTLVAAWGTVPIPTEQVCVDGGLFYCRRYVEKTTGTTVNGYWFLGLELTGDGLTQIGA